MVDNLQYGYNERTCRDCMQKDEEIRKLEAELSKTTINYREALEKKLQDTRNVVGRLESEKDEIEAKAKGYEIQIKAAEKNYQNEVQNMEDCNSALYEEQAAHEELKKLLKETKDEAREQIKYEKNRREEVERTNKILREHLSAACRENETLQHGLSEAHKEKKLLIEALEKISGTSPLVSNTPTVGLDNSQIDLSHDDNRGISDDHTALLANLTTQKSPSSRRDNGPNIKSFDQEFSAIGKRSAEFTLDEKAASGATEYDDARKKLKTMHPRTSRDVNWAPTEDQNGHTPSKFEFTFSVPAPGSKHAPPVSRSPKSAARDTTDGQIAWPNLSDKASARS
ncbi:uncharacterized protein ALTATR162_LOCUS4981 [Alternaria atra]|uniref:Uncharacterized protein n=1 Tax=Alternaria atra TaxID=119953 RepID=A0A8J2I0U3_9PLEO|nr:uncharacterized protein ALTATR162_LOCUS4981 [Alternaria atra]CAG5158097.1 unnamed protein product [Alternaria atra]